jgi:tight adherence protein C
METVLSGPQSWMFAAAAGAAIALLVWGGMVFSSTLFNPVRRRLAALRDSDAGAAMPNRRTGPTGGWLWMEPTDPEKRAQLRLRMAQAGLRFRGAAGALRAAKVALVIGLPAAALLVAIPLAQGRLQPALIVLLAGFAAFIGWLLPDGFLQRRIASRQATLMDAFPDALDLLVACTEAGLSFNAALERVVEQMPASQPALAQELSLVNAEVRAGVDRTAALKNLAERTGLDEIRGLVSLITHSTRLGTGIAGTLRIYAEDFRDRRMQRAEEIAATVSTKLIFPLVLCLFPAFFVVAIGPAVVNVMRVLSNNPLPGG